MNGTFASALVTGGGGFLGGAIVDALLRRGVQVSSVSRRIYPDLEARGVRGFAQDLGEGPGPVRGVIEASGADTVFHCAALPGVFGARAAFERANVAATAHVIEGCRAAGVARLVFTSSPSVVFDGTDHVDAGPELPYPDRYLAHYPRTKAEAERMALAADGPDLAVCALRPHLIFGPGDPNLLPRLLERADQGRLRVVGDRSARVSLTYVDNGAEAHAVAAECLAADPRSPLRGRAFFVNNREPVRLWDWIDEVLEGTGRTPVTRRISPRAAYAAGATLEALWRTLRLSGEPPMTRFVARQLSTSHTYDMAPFEAATGGRFREQVPMAEATQRAIASLVT